MKITGLVSYWARGTVYVKVETDMGISGYGECSRVGEEVVPDILHKVIKPIVLGKDPFNTEQIEHAVIAKKYKISGQLLAMAFSGVEMACWDIKGKSLGVPVYQLLGGLFRKELEFYGSSMSRDLSPAEEAAKVAGGIAEYGVRAVKMKVGPRFGTGGLVDLEHDVERVRVMRETIGTGVKLMLDANSSYTYAQAVQFFERVRGYDIFHYEEPCPYYDVEAYVKLAQLPVAIHVGEQDWNLYTFRDFIARGGCHLYAADVVKCGGIANSRRAAGLCRAFGITYAPHNTSRGVGLAATMQLAAALPECGYYLEWKIGDDPSEQYLAEPFRIHGGKVEVPSKPGLGVELDLEKMERTMEVRQ